MPKFIEFPDLNQTVEVPDDITDAGIDDVYKTLSRQQFRAKQGQVRAEGMEAQTKADVLDAYQNDPEMPLLMRSELGRRVAGGMANMAGSAMSAGSMLLPGDASKSVNAYGKELSRMGDIASTAPGSLSEIEDASDVAGYAGRMIAEQIPQLLVSGPVAGGLKAAGLGAKTAAMLAPVITTFPQEAGAIYQDITDQTGETGLRQRATAVGGGLISSALEAVGGDARALRNLVNEGGDVISRNLLKNLGRGFVQGARDEALTEAGQEAIAALAPGVSGGEFPTGNQLLRRVGEAAVGGALTGGTMGAVSKQVGDSAYVAALTDSLSPEANQGGTYVKRDRDGNVMRDELGRLIVGVRGGINSDEGLQPYRGARIEEDRPAAFRANPNDIDSLSAANQIATARSNAATQRRDEEIAAGRTADQAREAEAQRLQAEDEMLAQRGIDEDQLAGQMAVGRQSSRDQRLATFTSEGATLRQQREAQAAAEERRLEQEAIRDQRRSQRNAVNEGLTSASGQTYDIQAPPEPETPPAPSRPTIDTETGLRQARGTRSDVTSPIDAYMMSRAPRRLNLPQPIADLYSGVGSIISAVNNNEEVDPQTAADLAVEAPNIASQLKVRIENAIASGVSDADINPLIDLANQLDAYPANYRAYAELTQEMMTKARRTSERRRGITPTKPQKISPPTDISLPAETGVASGGGVPASAPAPLPNDSQNKAPVSAPAATVKSTKAKAPRGAGNTQTTQAQVVAAPVVEPEPPTPPKLQDGTPVAVGDFVSVRGYQNTGNVELIGTVDRIEGGRVIVRITNVGRGGENIATRKGFAPKQEIAVTNESRISKTDPIEEKVPQKRGRKSSMSDEFRVGLQARMDVATKSNDYLEYRELRDLADKGDDEAAAELDQFEEARAGNPLLRDIQAAYEFNRKNEVVEKASLRLRVQNEKTVLDEYDRVIYSWLVDPRKPSGFSRKLALEAALLKEFTSRPEIREERNKKRREDVQKKQESEISTVTESVLGEEVDSDNSSTYADRKVDSSADIEIDNPADAEARREAATARNSAPYAIQNAVVEAFKGNKQKLPAKPQLTKVIAAALSKHAAIDPQDAEAVGAAKEYSRSLADLVAALFKQGIPLTGMGERLSRMFANKNYFGSNGQSLSLGEFTLKEAIDSVIDMADTDGVLAIMAKKLLKAGVNAKVVVLSDADFDQLGAPAGEVAYYDPNPNGNTIFIRQSASYHDYLVMHEAIHAATVHALKTNVRFRNEVGRLRAMAVEALGTDYYGLQDRGNNFINLAEFIAEGFTNPEFRAKLEAIPVKDKGIWSTIKGMFGKIFGFNQSEQTVLDALLDMASSNFAPNVEVQGQTEPLPILNAAKPFTSAQQVIDALKIPDSEGQAAIMDSARSTQQLLPREVADQVRNSILPDNFRDLLSDINEELDDKERAKLIKAAKDQGFDYGKWINGPERRADNDLKSTLRLAELTEQDGKRISDITDPRMKREASFVVTQTAMRIEQKLRLNQQRKESLQKAANDPNDPLNVALEELKSIDGMIAATADDAIAEYREYLRNLRTESKLSGLSVNEQVVDIATRAQRLGRQTNQIGDAIVNIASKLTEDEVKNAKTNADLVQMIRDKAIIDGSPIQNLLSPADGTPGLLLKYSGLKAALLHIQSLKKNEAQVAADIDAAQKAFATAVGKKKAGYISLGEFARAYVKLVTTLGEIANVNRKIARRTKDIRVAELIENALTDVTSSPEYVEQRNEAVRTEDRTIYGINGRNEGNYHIIELGQDPNDPTKLEEFRFLNTVNRPADNAANAETYVKLLSKIDAMMDDPATSPELRHTLAKKRMELEIERDDRVEGAMGLSLADPIGYFRRLPFVKSFITANLPAWLMNGPLGKRIRGLQDTLDRLHVQIKDLTNNQNYGRKAITLASVEAMKSHAEDMPPGLNLQQQEEWWVANVLEQVLSQNQNIKEDTLKAGDFTRNNVKVTKEDIKAAQMMAKWNEELRKIIETTSGIAQFFPTRILETINGVTYSRLAYAQSSMTVPRLLNRLTTPSGNSGSPMDIVNRWSQLKTTEEKIEFLADHEAFDTLALSHVAELNSEYKRTSENEQVYRKLAREWRKKGTAPTSLQELVDQIDREVSPDADVDDDIDAMFDEDEGPTTVEKLIKEIDDYTKKLVNQSKVTAKENSARLASKVGESTRSELSVLIELDGENAFTKPRLEMVAPSSFYRYELATAQSFGALKRGALMPLQLQQLDLYGEYANKLNAAIIELTQERDRKQWSDFTKEMVSSSKGDIYMTSREMKRMLKQLKVVESALEDALNVRPASSENPGFASKMMDFIKSQMLSALTTLTNNAFSGVMTSRAVSDMVLKGPEFVGPGRVLTRHSVGTLRDIAATLFQKSPGVDRFLRNAENGPLRLIFQNLITASRQIMAARNHLGNDGFTLKQDIAFRALGDSAFARNQFGQEFGAQLAEKILSAPGVRHYQALMNKVVDRQERLTNLLSIKYFDEAFREYFYNLSKIIEQRIADGKAGTLDFSKPENRFTAKELASVKLDPNTWARQLRLFNTTKTIEQMAMDYYQRVQKAKAEGQNWTMVPFTEDDGIYGDMMEALGRLNNQPALSNRPTITRARTQFGDFARQAVLFPGYANGYLSTLQLMQTIAKAQDIPDRMKYTLGQSIILFLTLLAIGIPAAELKKWMYRVFYGRPYPAETFSDLANSDDVTGSRLARVSGAALATTIPYLGEYIASAMGAQNYKAAVTDLANMSLPLKLATAAYDTAKSYVQTGDETGAALSVARNLTPGATPLINRLPAIQARNAAADAVRVAKVNRGDLEVPERGGGGGFGGQQTEFGSTINKALAASAAGDMSAAKQYIDKATKLKADAGDKNPQASVRNAIQSRRPEYKAFGRRLSDDEKSGLLNRMSAGQRNVFTKAENAASKLLEMTLTKTAMAKTAQGRSAIDRVNKRISKIRKSAKPKSLTALNKRIRAIKPKKLKIGKASAATGSRLLRPRARVKGASALLPSVL